MIATSGYSYEDWKNVFYPADLPKNKMLEYYVKHFSCTEINSTYYAIPGSQVFERMLLKVPENFEFIVKTHQETTHHRRENKAALVKLVESVKPLTEAGVFKGFLAQFPYSFKNNEINRKYLAQTRDYIKELPLFIEFRNASWFKPQVKEFLQTLDMGYVNVDEPQLTNLLPPESNVTAENAYIRFHGRNGKDWWDGKGSARYDYEYNEEELRGWLTNISKIIKKAYKTYIFFNNHPNGQAVRNAKQLIDILKSTQESLFLKADNAGQPSIGVFSVL